jgi:hypothetical protein
LLGLKIMAAAGLQNVQFWEASVPAGLRPTSAQVGGSRALGLDQRPSLSVTCAQSDMPRIAEYGWRAVASATQMISRGLSASGRHYAPWRSAWRGAIRGGDAHPAGQRQPGEP